MSIPATAFAVADPLITAENVALAEPDQPASDPSADQPVPPPGSPAASTGAQSIGAAGATVNPSSTTPPPSPQTARERHYRQVWKDWGKEKNVLNGNFLIVGAGVAMVPDYEGSKNQSITPAAGILGRVGPIGFSPRAAGIAFNFVPSKSGQRITFSLGPVIRRASNRHGDVDNRQVEALGKLPATWELGAATGVTLHKLLSPYDALSVSADFRWDVSGHGAGRIITPSVGYYTPLSRGILIGGNASMDIVDAKFANYNYAISTVQSLASGLPTYVAHSGTKAKSVSGFAAFDLNGNFLDGGLSLVGGVSYSKLEGSAAETPMTSLVGQRSQVVYGVGLAYTF
jgi:outer membrane scaffolding protein for murein synthesis (MipA/OmpV family)